MLLFLHRFDEKCEFDTDLKIENYYHHDGEQLHFYKNERIKTQSTVLATIILQEMKNSNIFDKNCTQENIRCNIQHEESWRRWIVIEQVKYK